MSLLLRTIPKLRIHPSKAVFFLNQNMSKQPTPTPFMGLTCNPSFQRLCSTKSTPPVDQTSPKQKPTMQQKLKKAIAEYGSTVIVFHVTISLASLGISYLLVSSGLQVENLMEPLGISGEAVTRITVGAGTFAVAYAVHKIFAPVRILITLTATPFIVRYLRNAGILKKPIK